MNFNFPEINLNLCNKADSEHFIEIFTAAHNAVELGFALDMYVRISFLSKVLDSVQEILKQSAIAEAHRNPEMNGCSIKVQSKRNFFYEDVTIKDLTKKLETLKAVAKAAAQAGLPSLIVESTGEIIEAARSQNSSEFITIKEIIHHDN